SRHRGASQGERCDHRKRLRHLPLANDRVSLEVACWHCSTGASRSPNETTNKRSDTMKSEELVTIYTVNNPIEAEIIKTALEAEGLSCFLEGFNQAGGITGVEIKIQVPADQVEQAREILAEHEQSRAAESEPEEE